MSKRGYVVRRSLWLLLLALLVAGSALSPVRHRLAVAAAVPEISIDDVSVTEGDGGSVSAVFTLTSSVRGKASVVYTTGEGSAQSPVDFVTRKGTVRFAGKKLTRKISITVVGDLLDEKDETFVVRLSSPVGATLADAEGTGTIEDDDPMPSVSVPATASVPEGNDTESVATVDVTLDAPSGRPVTVEYATTDGSATAGADYTADSGTVEFAPGQTSQTLLVSVAGDLADESNETFTIDLSSPVNATIDASPTLVTIVDNDPIPPGSAQLDITGGKVREGASGGTATITFTVSRSGETTTAVSTDVVTTNGSAIDTVDFEAASGTVSFLAGQTTATVDVTVLGDARLEHNETLFVTMSNPSVGVAYVTPQATGRILDDDTRTTLRVSKRGASVYARGLVSPARPGHRIAITLFKRKGGAWVRVRGQRALLSGKSDVNGDTFTDSAYAAKFRRSDATRCRITAGYRGDSRFSASGATVRFRC